MNNNSIADEFAPTQFFLSQNYPNPFRDKTVIKYCIPIKTKVHLAIYTTDGKELKVLINEIKDPGTYEVEIDLHDKHVQEKIEFPDGYYFYKMTSEEFSSEKKWFCKNSLYGKLRMKNFLQLFM